MANHQMFRIFSVSLLLFSMATVAAYSQEKLEHTKDSLDTVKMNLKSGKAVLFDVREADEWKEGHLEQAHLVPLSKLKDGTDPKSIVKELDAKKVIYCHCRAGRRALTAGEMLKKLGYDVRPLKQGYEELLEGGLPKSK